MAAGSCSATLRACRNATFDLMDTTGLEALAAALRAGKKVTMFVGAGISTSAGIPDFRSPDTGLYANLARLNLPYAEAVFDIDYFRHHPQAFYTLAHELYPGRFAPTAFHRLVRLLQDKQLLHRVYTQNIDTLERMAGVREELIVEAHGSFAHNHCIDCGEEMSVAEFGRQLGAATPQCPECHGHVKPDIVFFGEQLPARFFEAWQDDCDAVEVAVVAGTSLTVHPFAALPSQVGAGALRVLVNKEAVGDFRARRRSTDVVVEGECDAAAEALCEMMGWELAAEAASEETRAAVSEASDASEETQAAVGEASDASEGTQAAVDEARNASEETQAAVGEASTAAVYRVSITAEAAEAAEADEAKAAASPLPSAEEWARGQVSEALDKATGAALNANGSIAGVAEAAASEASALESVSRSAHDPSSASVPASAAPASASPPSPSTREALEALSRLRI